MAAEPGATRRVTDINVTPLVDVVLVLLIIFMVLTPIAEKQMYLRVPELETPSTQVVPPDAVPPDQVVLTALRSGRVLLNREELTLEQAVERLGPAFAGRPSRVLFFAAEDGVRYARAVDVLDAARRAGVNTIGMMTDPPVAAP